MSSSIDTNTTATTITADRGLGSYHDDRGNSRLEAMTEVGSTFARLNLQLTTAVGLIAMAREQPDDDDLAEALRLLASVRLGLEWCVRQPLIAAGVVAAEVQS